jgi:dephospho-CoA kinase
MANLEIGVVGPCSAGKSTLISELRDRGYSTHHIAQEHSLIPDMWKRMNHPHVLIYLDVSYEVSMRRRPLDMSENEFAEQVQRLSHARQHADLYISTNNLDPREVLKEVIDFLKNR